MPLDIVLVEPEIPQNTGNIARTCVATGSRLHLVEPLGFSLDDKYLKRAGLDYWFDLDVTLWPDFESLISQLTAGREIYYMTTKGGQVYSEKSFGNNVVLVFGRETKGLPEPLLLARPDRCLRIPMLSQYRSLNLSNAVAVAAYEVLRQQRFPNLLEASDYLGV